MSFNKTGPYYLKPHVLTAVIPTGVFIRLVGCDGEGVEVEVLTHPDFDKMMKGEKQNGKQEESDSTGSTECGRGGD